MDEEAGAVEPRAIIEAILFSSDAPVSLNDLSAILDGLDAGAIRQHIEALNAEYEQTARSFCILSVAGGYQFGARPAYARWIKRLYRGRIPSRLTQASLECLAIIAYKQPISRTEIEAIRGVNVDGVLRTLLDRSLIRIAGRGEGVGRPILYATTSEFLRYFGLNKLSDLPKIDELKEMLRERDREQQVRMEEEDAALFPEPHTPIFERDETE
jgi:segregation and condensation protein B